MVLGSRDIPPAPSFRAASEGPAPGSFLTSPRRSRRPGYRRGSKAPAARFPALTPSVASFNGPTNVRDSSVNSNHSPRQLPFYFVAVFPPRLSQQLTVSRCPVDSPAAPLALPGCCLLAPQKVSTPSLPVPGAAWPRALFLGCSSGFGAVPPLSLSGKDTAGSQTLHGSWR